VGIVDEDIERVRAAVPIVDVVQQYVSMRRVGVRWVGLCPFHAEKTASFGVNEALGIYKCFGCNAGGDVISFIREIEHLDFVGAVELLANRAGIQLRYTSGGEGRDRQRRQVLLDAMARAVDWYHARLLEAPDARPARDYLRSRGITGDTARRFRLGWAPDDWDALVQSLGVPGDVARDTGLAFVNRRDRLQDSFRARVMFPILNEAGEAVAFGGRVLPGSADPAKYKNSPETRIYAKSKTLYGLNWAKADIVTADQVVVCEGYTDVIGFHRAGVPRAVATCGTALTEEHVRLLKRFAGRMVLAFDADDAGQGAAARFYEWEKKYDIEVSVVRLPAGQDPGALAQSDPEALRAAVDQAVPFLRFRLDRVLRQGSIRTPERKARLAEAALAVIREHPDQNVQRLYAGEVAAQTGLAPATLLAALQSRRPVRVDPPATRPAPKESAEAVALALLVHRWDDIAPWLVEPLFADELHLSAFRALAEAHGDARKAMELADPATRELLERLAVTDVDEDPDRHARHLIGVAARRWLDGMRGDFSRALEHADGKRLVEQLDDPEAGPAAAEQLLGWLDRSTDAPAVEERA
jgi:DNA primase